MARRELGERCHGEHLRMLPRVEIDGQRIEGSDRRWVGDRDPTQIVVVKVLRDAVGRGFLLVFAIVLSWELSRCRPYVAPRVAKGYETPYGQSYNCAEMVSF